MSERIAFLGAGRWALALALKLADKGHTVALWEANRQNLDRLLASRTHPDLPQGTVIPGALAVLDDLASVVAGASLVVFAVPSDSLAAAARPVSGMLKSARALVTVTKGIDPSSLKRMSLVLSATIPGKPVVVLAGPGIPYDMVRGDPTSLVAASEDDASAQLVRDVFSGGTLRVYSHTDVAGVELGAALKNVVALAAGIGDGLGLGINAKAALLTRGLAEITRLGLAFNANPMTFAGLSGMGDLIVTAFSDHSRNHTLGVRIGRGESPAAAQASLNGVAEGAVTCRSARTLAGRQGVDMPITEEVYRIIYEGIAPQESMERLLKRKPKSEIWQ